MNNFKSDFPFLVLYTKDISVTFEFYKLLGLNISENSDDKVVVNFGGHDLHFILEDTEPVEEYRGTMPESINSAGKGLILYIESTKIERDFDLVKKANEKILKEIYKNHWNYSEFLFEDPNGYKFAVWG